MIECPACRVTYVTNTIFCTECGLYLLKSEPLGTDPLETVQVQWMGDANHIEDMGLVDTQPPTVRMRISIHTSCLACTDKKQNLPRELEVSLIKPVRLGRIDPTQDIYPEIDLTTDLAMEHGVSREHACIFHRGRAIEVEDLGSTNGTLLNGERLDPYIPETLKDGDQLQLGKLLIEVSFKGNHIKTPAHKHARRHTVH